jgi:hypothetical protein
MKKTVIIIHKDRTILRTEAQMQKNHFGATLNEQVNDLIDDCRIAGTHPTIIIQGRTIERIIKH